MIAIFLVRHYTGIKSETICPLTVVNLLSFRVGNIKSATVSSQLTEMENCYKKTNANSQETLYAIQFSEPFNTK